MYEDKVGNRPIQGNGLGADQIEWAIQKCKVDKSEATQSDSGTGEKADDN